MSTGRAHPDSRRGRAPQTDRHGRPPGPYTRAARLLQKNSVRRSLERQDHIRYVAGDSDHRGNHNVTDLKSRTIYRALRERILRNELTAGTRLVLRELANQYNASDIPVREALRVLERD